MKVLKFELVKLVVGLVMLLFVVQVSMSIIDSTVSGLYQTLDNTPLSGFMGILEDTLGSNAMLSSVNDNLDKLTNWVSLDKLESRADYSYISTDEYNLTYNNCN